MSCIFGSTSEPGRRRDNANVRELQAHLLCSEGIVRIRRLSHLLNGFNRALMFA